MASPPFSAPPEAPDRRAAARGEGPAVAGHAAAAPAPAEAGLPGRLERYGLHRRIGAGREAIIARWYEVEFSRERLERFQIEGAGDLERGHVCEHFLRPLLGLLGAYLRTGESRYRDLYLDERLRYAPHRADPGVRRAFFREVLPACEEAVLAAVRPHVARDGLREVLRQLHAPLLDGEGGQVVKLLAVGDCLLNEVRVFLRTRCALRGVSLDMRCVYFSSALGRDLSRAEVEALADETRFDLFAFSFFTYEGLPPYTAMMRQADALSPAEIRVRAGQLLELVDEYLTKLRERTDAPFLLHNVSGLPLTRYRRYLPLVQPLSRGRRRVADALNAGLQQLADAVPNVLLVDERQVAQDFGWRAAGKSVVPRRLERGAFFHTARFGEPLAAAYADVIASYRDLRKAKVLLVDFDYTLWDGVMADGPVRHRLEEQQLLRRLKEAGILLVALSRNDVRNIRWEEMALRPEDFVLLKVSWNLKVQSIEEAAAELDLGLDSFVMIDDSAEERALVRERFPSIPALDSTAAGTWASLERLLRFPNTRATEEARTRTELYRAQAKRREAQRASSAGADYPAMMASLELRLRFGRAAARDLDRLTELVQRTNQFNTTTIRYTRDELAKALLEAERAIYVAELVDRFGSFGLVGVVVAGRGEASLTIESFVMSCRAMGFGLEQGMLRLVLDAEGQASRVVGRFVPTDRNSPAARLFADSGFEPAGATEWLLADRSRGPVLPSWFTVERRP